MLEALKSTLIASIKNGKLELTADLLGIDAFEDVLRLLNLNPLEIPLGINASDLFIEPRPVNKSGVPVPHDSPDIDFNLPPVETLLLNEASANLLGASSDNFTAFIWEKDGQLEIVVRGTFSGIALLDLVTLGLVDLPDIELPILNFTNFTIEGVSLGRQLNLAADTSNETIDLIPGIGLTMVGPGFRLHSLIEGTWPTPQTLSLEGTVQIGEASFSPSIEIPLDLNIPWNLNVGQAIENISMQDVFQLLAGTNIFQALPSELELGDSFSVTTFQVEFDFSETTPALKRIKLGLDLPDWTIMGEGATALVITGPTLNFDITDPLSSSRTVETLITGGFRLGDGADALDLNVQVLIPGDSRDWLITAAPTALNLSSLAAFSAYLGDQSLDELNLPAGIATNSFQLNLFELAFNPAKQNISQVAVSLALEGEWGVADQFSLTSPFLTLTALYPTDSTRRIVSVEAGARLSLGESDFVLFGQRNESAVQPAVVSWTFMGTLDPSEAGNEIPIGELVLSLLNISRNQLPDFADSFYDFSINTLVFTIDSSTEAGVTSTGYTFFANTNALLSLDLGDGLPVSVDGLSIELYYDGDQTQVEFCGYFNLLNFEFSLCYRFNKDTSSNYKEIELEWEGIVGTYETGQADASLTLEIEDRSLGDILASLVNAIKGGGRFRLPAPWDILNDLSLAGLSFTYGLTGASKGNLALSFNLDQPIKLGFLNIDGLSLRRGGSNQELMVNIDGDFLFGQPIPEWNATEEDPPEVPGQGTSLLDLRLLALGQHVEIINAGSFANMEEAILAMRNFGVPGTNTPLANGDVSGIRYNDASNWLVGMDFGLLKLPAGAGYTLQLAVLFNDPNLYGLRLALDGDKVAIFKGLEFEILYKKISDSVGQYHIELILPDIMRYLEFGAASIVLPEIVVDIYTNGDFKVDLGFPYELDFARSFSMTVIVLGIPFLGSGGLYFGKLSSATTDLAPETDLGTFNPVFIFGLGLQVGIGKAVSYGPLKARFSLTILGVLEGVIATFNPYDGSVASGQELEKTKYYWIQGTLGLQGILDGEVDFKVIKGTVFVRVYIIVQLTLESYRQTKLLAEAGVDVKVKAKVGVGVLAVKVSFSFKATISVEFTIGENSIAPWEGAAASSSMLASSMTRAQLLGTESLSFIPNNILAEDRKSLSLYLSLQPSVEVNAGGQLESVYVAMLSLDSPSIDQENTGSTAFEILAQEVFYWIVNSIVSDVSIDQNSLDKQVLTRTQIEDALTYLRTETATGSPLTEADLLNFLNTHLEVDILEPDPAALAAFTEAAIFPMPNQVTIKMDSSLERNLDTFSAANGAYIDFLEGYFDLLTTQVQSEPAPENTSENSSIATQLLIGYFELMIKHQLEDALQILKGYTYQLEGGESLQSILSDLTQTGATTLSVESIALDNRFHPLLLAEDSDLASVLEDEAGLNYDLSLMDGVSEINLHVLANTYNTSVESLANALANVADLFDHSTNNQLTISELNQLTVSSYLSKLQAQRSAANLSGLLSRFLLGGTRLPKNADLNLSEAGFVNNQDYSFYRLTGQQFVLPTLSTGNTHTFTIEKNAVSNQDWFSVNGNTGALNHLFTDGEIGDIQTIRTAADSWSKEQAPIAPINPVERFPRNYNFSSYIEWLQPDTGQNALIWPVNEALANYLQSTPRNEEFAILAGTFNQASRRLEFENSNLHSAWGALINLEIKRDPANATTPYHYELIGSDERGIAVLQALFTSSLQDKIKSVEILFGNDPIENRSGYQNRSMDLLTTFLVQNNLSTETNPNDPISLARFSTLPGDNLRGILPGNLDFLQKIWTASITRTGGYYLYFQDYGPLDALDAKGFADYLFDANQMANIQLLVTFMDDMAPGPYWNCLVTNRAIDLSNSQLYAQSSVQEDVRTMLPVGTLGFRNERDLPLEPTPGNTSFGTDYLDNIFQLLTYRFDEGSSAYVNTFSTAAGEYPLNPSPVGPTEPQADSLSDPSSTPPNSEAWNYEIYLPLYRFVSQASAYLLPPTGSDLVLPPASENPYAGLETSPTIHFFWRDLYGNQPFGTGSGRSYTPDAPIQYHDDIIPISNWPQLQYHYELGALNADDPSPTDPSHQKKLSLVLSFNDGIYPGAIDAEGQAVSLSDRKESYANDRRRYQQIYYQLYQKSVTGSEAHLQFQLLSTLLGDDIDNLNAGLLSQVEAQQVRNFVAEIHHFLATKAENPDNAIPVPQAVEITRTFALEDISTAAIAELNVYFQLQRPLGLVEPSTQQTQVHYTRTTLKPQLEINENEETTISDSETLSRQHTLIQFAEQFEADFADVGSQGLKLATGIDKLDINANIKSKDLWFVRMEAVEVTIDQARPVYYAMSPLSTQLISREVSVYRYSNGLDTTDSSSVSFADIDLDDWARTFVEAVEEFLRPDLAMPAFLVDRVNGTSHLESIRQSKKTLAGQIAKKQLERIFEDSPNDPALLTTAMDKLEQQLLIQLKKAYEINTVVQFPAVGSAVNGQAKARFYGKPLINMDVDGDGTVEAAEQEVFRNYSFSNGKVALDTDTNLTFLFSTKKSRTQPAVPLNLDYQITHLEIDVEEVIVNEDETAYEGSTWLTFVLPTSTSGNQQLRKSLGTLEIPVVLRDYPDDVNLLQQKAVQSYPPSADATALETLQNATAWDYEVFYTQNLAAQDQLSATVQLNLQPVEMATFSQTTGRTLFDELATFITLYPAIKGDLHATLLGLDATATSDDIDPATPALSAFAQLVQNVANAWSTWANDVDQITNPTPTEQPLESYSFRIREQEVLVGTDWHFQVEVIPPQDFQEQFTLPTIQIGRDRIVPEAHTGPEAGHFYWRYKKSDGAYLTWAAAKSDPNRTFFIDLLNILAYQNANLEVFLERNVDLVGDLQTRDSFIYKTPTSKFASRLVPFLDNRIEINLGEVDEDSSADSITNHLVRFLQVLLDKENQDQTPELKLSVDYAYQLPEQEDLPFITTPIVMAPPFEFVIDANNFEASADGFIGNLAREMEEWLQRNKPSTRMLNRRFVMDLAIFSHLEGSKLPMLRLRNVILKMEDIS